MGGWRIAREPSLDEVLDDEIMQAVTRRAGLSPAELRRQLAEIARRIRTRSARSESCCGAAVD